jgi:hypothetical protein
VCKYVSRYGVTIYVCRRGEATGRRYYPIRLRVGNNEDEEDEGMRARAKDTKTEQAGEAVKSSGNV